MDTLLKMVMDLATLEDISLPLSDQEKDCKVALNRVMSIFRLKAYSASNFLAIWKK
jgi:hypothetical protein